LEVGKLADFLCLNRNNYPLVPLNEPIRQLVYCENGSSIDTIVVDGQIVMQGGKLLSFDEAGLMRELRALFERARPIIEAEDAATGGLAPSLAVMVDETRKVPAAEILGQPRPGM
jgi:5-methylthioadenosine/S-adenosylhomocysteine deaminase